MKGDDPTASKLEERIEWVRSDVSDNHNLVERLRKTADIAKAHSAQYRARKSVGVDRLFRWWIPEKPGEVVTGIYIGKMSAESLPQHYRYKREWLVLRDVYPQAGSIYIYILNYGNLNMKLTQAEMPANPHTKRPEHEGVTAGDCIQIYYEGKFRAPDGEKRYQRFWIEPFELMGDEWAELIPVEMVPDEDVQARGLTPIMEQAPHIGGKWPEPRRRRK